MDAGLIAAAFALPNAVLSHKAGYLVDKVNNNFLFLCSNLVVASGALFALTSDNQIAFLLAILVRSTGRCFTSILSQRHISLHHTYKEYVKVNSTISLISNIAKVAAPLLFSLTALYLPDVNKLVFSLVMSVILVLNCLLYTLRKENIQIEDISNPSQRSTSNGYKLISKDAYLLWGTIVYCLSIFAVYISDDLLAYLYLSLGGQGAHIGTLIATIGAGGIIGSYLVPYIERISGLLRTFLISLCFDAVCFLAYFLISISSFSSRATLLMLVAFCMGVGTAFGIVGFRSLAQQRSNASNIGKIYGTIQSITSITVLILPLTGALIADTFGNGVPFLITSIILVICSLLLITRFSLLTSTKDKLNVEQ